MIHHEHRRAHSQNPPPPPHPAHEDDHARRAQWSCFLKRPDMIDMMVIIFKTTNVYKTYLCLPSCAHARICTPRESRAALTPSQGGAACMHDTRSDYLLQSTNAAGISDSRHEIPALGSDFGDGRRCGAPCSEKGKRGPGLRILCGVCVCVSVSVCALVCGFDGELCTKSKILTAESASERR